MMEYLYAPWRSEYVKQSHGKGENLSKDECIFCDCVQKDDVSCYVLYRAKFWFVMLNRFPYNTGHILIVPYEHISTLVAMSQEVRVPRWLGDTNFLPLLAQTKHISIDLNEMYKKLRKVFEGY